MKDGEPTNNVIIRVLTDRIIELEGEVHSEEQYSKSLHEHLTTLRVAIHNQRPAEELRRLSDEIGALV